MIPGVSTLVLTSSHINFLACPRLKALYSQELLRIRTSRFLSSMGQFLSWAAQYNRTIYRIVRLSSFTRPQLKRTLKLLGQSEPNMWSHLGKGGGRDESLYK